MRKSPLLVIFLIVLIDLLGFGIVIPILPYYATQFGANAFTLGWLMTSYSLLQFIFSPIWGRLSDRIGRRPVLLLSVFGSAIALAVLGGASNLAWLFLGRILGGICSANISTASAYITDVTTEANRTKGMGIIGAGFGLGFVFGPAIGGVLSKYGYSVPMYFASCLAIVNFVFVFLVLKESNTNRLPRQSKLNSSALKTAFGDARTRAAIFLFFIITLAFTQMEVTFALFMKAKFSLDAHSTGWLLAFMGIVMAIMQGGLVGRLSRIFGELRLIMFGTLIMATALFIMTNSGVLSGVVVAMGLVAIGYGMNNPSLSSLASKGASASRRGTVMGVYQSAGSLSRILGPPLAGYLFDQTSVSAPFLCASGLMLLAFLLASYFSIVIRK
ncbi:MAG: MFS transporter [Bacteriovoracia bacterium]